MKEIVDVITFSPRKDSTFPAVLKEWNYFQRVLVKNWNEGNITGTDDIAFEILTFMYDHREYFFQNKVLTEEQYESIILFLDSIIGFIWNSNNHLDCKLVNRDSFIQDVAFLKKVFN